MRRHFALASLTAASFALAAAFASGSACTSSAEAADAGDGGATGAYEDAPTFCDLFTEAGAPCPAASPTACFPMCATGGCFCRATPTGPRWVCTVDFSCVPEAGPLEDANVPPFDAETEDAASASDTGVDAAAPDATPDGGSASTDAGDASLDAADATD